MRRNWFWYVLLLLLLAARAFAFCDGTLTPTITPRKSMVRCTKNQCGWDSCLQAFEDSVDLHACFPGIDCAVNLSADTVGTLVPLRGGLGFDASGAVKGSLIAGTGPGAFGLVTPGADNLPLIYDATQPQGVRAGGPQTLGPILNSVPFAAGISNTGAGFQHTRTASCTPINGNQDTICVTAVTWATPFADTNYTVVCTIEATANTPILVHVDNPSKTAAAINVVHGNFAVGVSTGILDCLAVHD
jgi:hypothetical protein